MSFYRYKLGLIFVFVLAICGCRPSPLQIVAENQSGQELNNVDVHCNGKSVGFGVLVDKGIAGYMTAENIFGEESLADLSIKFDTEDGETVNRDVSFDSERKGQSELKLVIDKDLNASGKWVQRK